MSDVIRCTRCSGVIGLYEPAVTVDQSGIRNTSVAANPDLVRASEARYHRACYTAWFNGQALTSDQSQRRMSSHAPRKPSASPSHEITHEAPGVAVTSHRSV
jgi:hypothetical protein